MSSAVLHWQTMLAMHRKRMLTEKLTRVRRDEASVQEKADNCKMLPSIHTSRLTLQPVSESDIDELYALWREPEVRKFLWDGTVVAGRVEKREDYKNVLVRVRVYSLF